MICFNSLPDCSFQCDVIAKLHNAGKFSIGQSLCGRKIHALHFGSCQRRVLIVGGFHGTEYLTVLAALKFAFELLQGAYQNDCGVTIVPCVNPDGTEIAIHGAESAGKFYPLVKRICKDKSHWKANARGVDINHNFDANWQRVKQNELAAGITVPSPTRYGGACPESEPETRALVQLCKRHRYEAVLALHSQGREIYWDFSDCTPKQCHSLAKKLSDVSGYKVASPEPIATGGGFKDWFIQEFHRCGFTIEMGLGENPLPLSDFDSEYPIVKRILNTFLENFQSTQQ